MVILFTKKTQSEHPAKRHAAPCAVCYLCREFAMAKISAVIITFNEEKNIARCIDSLQGVADEVVVVDSFSKDATESICRERNVRFMQ
ncbi:MAG: glycosyltransferase, partial [Flavobacteriales bacterium]